MPIVSTSTSAFFERSRRDIKALRSEAESIQAQLGRGERLSKSSDDPVAASRLRTLMRTDKLSAIDVANANRANADLTLADSTLSDFSDYITHATELATQAASDTLTTDQRASIGQELQAIHDNLFALANARDSSGHALFGGESTADAYQLDAAGNAVYVGTPGAGSLPLGEGQSVTRSITGPEFLNFTVNGTPTNLMAVVKNLADALQSTATDPAGAARTALDSLSAGLDSVTTGQTVVGTRLAWIEMTGDRRVDMGETRSAEEADIGGTDVASAVAKLQETMTVLEVSQASFGKLASLTLFDQLR
ncbi:flagellar biosynthesis protein FlgL [Novosphingobium album (ex Liu et al. 2023)]|uniref:Flagellar biosynthesis protein FlgL n=1 Tax=Novosphingobium album (ex Liu et al. 2023) TaxID=3031130 RepID=A0ABT5WM71_9SPHN|nr:flagellar biosynthesis protein FlgL [Novosphingobium album (ex Liu et al. 2023)]MDE8651143.1 flagellar biosynthesis protein FlgL [Novosphingobium album (ex Liu et al. 2023)]